MSDKTLASSPWLVGGVECGGDALMELREPGCFSVWTVTEECTEDVEVGDASRPAMMSTDEEVEPGVGRWWWVWVSW